MTWLVALGAMPSLEAGFAAGRAAAARRVRAGLTASAGVGLTAFVVGAGVAWEGEAGAWAGAGDVADGGAAGGAEAIVFVVGGNAPGAGVNVGPGNPETGAEVAIGGIVGGVGSAAGGCCAGTAGTTGVGGVGVRYAMKMPGLVICR